MKQHDTIPMTGVFILLCFFAGPACGQGGGGGEKNPTVKIEDGVFVRILNNNNDSTAVLPGDFAINGGQFAGDFLEYAWGSVTRAQLRGLYNIDAAGRGNDDIGFLRSEFGRMLTRTDSVYFDMRLGAIMRSIERDNSLAIGDGRTKASRRYKTPKNIRDAIRAID